MILKLYNKLYNQYDTKHQLDINLKLEDLLISFQNENHTLRLDTKR